MQKVLIAVEEPDSATEDTPPADSSGGSAVDEVRPLVPTVPDSSE
jgi:hypothetical protein